MAQEYFLGANVPPDIHRFYQSSQARARREHNISPGTNATAHVMVKLPFTLEEAGFSDEADLRAWTEEVVAAWRRGPLSVLIGPVKTQGTEMISLDVKGEGLKAFIRHLQWRSWRRNMRCVRVSVPEPRIVLFQGLTASSFPTAHALVSAKRWQLQPYALDTVQIFRKGADGRWWAWGDEFSLAYSGTRRLW